MIFFLHDSADTQRCIVFYAMDEIEFASEGSITFKCAGKDAQIYVKLLLNNQWVECSLDAVFCLYFDYDWYGHNKNCKNAQLLLQRFSFTN